MGGDPIPGPKIEPLPSIVDVIILSRPCKLSKFIKTAKQIKDEARAGELNNSGLLGDPYSIILRFG